MQKDPNDRSLNGKEREQERIMVRRLQVQRKKAELEIEQFYTQISGIGVEIEAKKKVIEDIAERIEKGKKLVNGAKIKDVFPPAKPEMQDIDIIKTGQEGKGKEKLAKKQEEEKAKGGEKGEGKV